MFVARQPELDLLTAAAARAAGGQAQFVLVSGPSGIGKSVLVAHAVRRLGDFLHLSVFAEEIDGLVGYAALGQLAPVLARRGADAFPLLAAGPPTEATFLGVAAELVRMLGDLERGRPVVFVLEDAHWLDGCSARAVQLAVRRLGIEQALVIVTTRGGSRPIDLTWSRLASVDGFGTQIQVAPLTAAEVGELARVVHGRPLPPTSAWRLHTRTGGHPLHVRLLLEQLDWNQLVSTTGPLPVPRSLADAVMARLATATAPARELVIAVSVLGGTPSLPLASAVAGVDEGATAADEAVSAGLLEEVEGAAGRGLTVTHPLLAGAVMEGLSPSRRRAVHLTALGHVQGEAALRHRVAAAQGPDDDLARALVAAAIAHQEGGRTALAAAAFLACAEVTSDAVKAERRFLRGVALLLTAGDIVRANELAERVRECAPSGDRDTVLAGLAIASGRFEEAAEWVAAAGRDPAAREPRLAAGISLLGAILKVPFGAGGQAEAAEVLANPASPPNLLREARVLGAVACASAGDLDGGFALVAHLPRAVSRVAPGDLPLLGVRGGLQLWAGREDAALRDLRGVEAGITDGASVSVFLPFSLALLAEVELALGLWDDAIAHADLAVTVADAEGRALAMPVVRSVAGRVCAERGAFDQAADHLAASAFWRDVMPSPANRVYTALGDATLARAQGQPQAMLAALEPLAAAGIRFRRGAWQVLRAEALLANGQVAPARELAGELAGAVPGRPAAAGLAGLGARLAYAQALLADGDGRAAGRVVTDLAGEMLAGRPFHAARVDLVRATVLLAAGEAPSGVTVAQRALQGFTDLGAQPWMARCEQVLAGAGELGGAWWSRVEDTLTRREREVANLAAAGLSNAEIAAHLYVSRKAVEYHLTNVYAKLGISSRRELPTRLGAGRPRFDRPS
ncbi:MAG: AAA family ATPase [Frankia sp.]